MRSRSFLLVVIGWTVLPHLSHLPTWCAALTGIVLLWRARLALVGAALPGRWVLLGVLRYLFLVLKRGAGGDPSRLAVRDPYLLLATTGWLTTLAIILYH